MFSDDCQRAIRQVSQEIASELHGADHEGCTEAEMVAECTLDANRLTMAGHPQADDEVRRLINKHGYQSVLASAAKIVAVW